jgi:hypothetical protein
VDIVNHVSELEPMARHNTVGEVSAIDGLSMEKMSYDTGSGQMD